MWVRSREQSYREIRQITKILAPGRDLAWLGEIESDLRYEARPRPKHHRIVPSHRLLKLGLELISRGETSGHLTELRRARLVRDGLMIALLSLCPIRLGNFASLRIGQQIWRINGVWWIMLEANETKSGRPDERPVPEVLTLHIDRWLERWRPLFRDPEDAFWPSTKGGALAYTYIGQIITETTLRELGVAVNPHLFRDCAVFTVATVAGDRMGIASGLLQHTQLTHYREALQQRRDDRCLAEVSADPSSVHEQMIALGCPCGADAL